MEHTLNLWDLVVISGLPKDKVMAIRHTGFNQKKYYDLDPKNFHYLEEYQNNNEPKYFFNREYVLSFFGGPGTTARFFGCYRDENPEMALSDYLKKYEKLPEFDYPPEIGSNEKQNTFHDLILTDYLLDLRGRLVIDWGKGVKAFRVDNQDVIANKPVIALSPDENHAFPGYENVIWDFHKMSEYVKNPEIYAEICDALKAVNGVYLVTDPENGKFYVGSAYGTDGIYGRWLDYAKTNGVGGNLGVKEYLEKNPGQYKKFQYSILAVFYLTGNKDKDKATALEMEKLYKKKLATVNTDWGLNKDGGIKIKD